METFRLATIPPRLCSRKPTASASATSTAARLSNAFYNILVAAGLAVKKSHKAAEHGKGRSARREQNDLSFHCLRHTATSLLKNAGVNEAVAMEFIGHDSPAVSRPVHPH